MKTSLQRSALRVWPLSVLLILTFPTVLFSKPDNATAFDELLVDIESARLEHDVPAVALTLVSTQEMLWTGALGLADLENRKMATADTLFRIGSITKAFTALAMLILQEEGLLNLNDSLKALVPDAPLSNSWESKHPVRLVHLLEHTAGLLDITKAEFDHNDPTPLTLEEGLVFLPEARKSQWPPGLHASYSNAGAGLAAYALEKVTGKRYEDFVKQRLFKPLGMHTANFFLDDQTRYMLATGYDRDGHSIIPYWHMIFRPFGGINARPREMAGFLQMLLNYGKVGDRRIMSASSIRRMEYPATTLAASSGLRYGYGLGNYASAHKGFLFHGHGGDGDGYLAHYAYNRESGLGYFVVINAFNGKALSDMRDLIQDYIVRGLTPRIPVEAEVDANRLLQLTGTYEPVTHRFAWTDPERNKRKVLHVALEDGKFYTLSNAGKKRFLVPVDDRHFRRLEEPVATIAFVEYEGELYLQGDLGNYRRINGTVKVTSIP